MAQATVKTVQFIDPRIEPQPDPVYDHVIGPTQNQYYKIPASGLSDSSVTFNNLTTLGTDRAYLDTFELEISAQIIFNLKNVTPADPSSDPGKLTDCLIPLPDEWTFESFPFNKCCDEARVNINGGAFFSQPMSYIRAKERYMDQEALANSYENVCPCHRAIGQSESGHNYLAEDGVGTDQYGGRHFGYAEVYDKTVDDTDYPTINVYGQFASRLGAFQRTWNQDNTGLKGSNMSILRLGNALQDGSGYENYYRLGDKVYVNVTWREPVFCSPFSSRYDANYGRPLYNVTSIDLAFTLQDLGNMIRVSNLHHPTLRNGGEDEALPYLDSYTIHLRSANICYQVATIPPILQKPLTTLVPYRRFVPYITDYTTYVSGNSQANPLTGASQKIHIRSGVYTLNEIPTAIWVFCGPSKRRLQTNEKDSDRSTQLTAASGNTEENLSACGNFDSTKTFAYLEHLSITMANTTQILNQAEPYDLYRIAKTNGCDDSYQSWYVGSRGLGNTTLGDTPLAIYAKPGNTATTDHYTSPTGMIFPAFDGCGSVLRLRPGVDLIIPDQPLIPGANANNMVFQAEGDFTVPMHSAAQTGYSLWLLFEYVGVAAISPGQCEITMNPLGTGEIMAASPVMSATSTATEGTLEGNGFWDRTKKGASIAAQIANEGIISRILKHIPGAEKAAAWVASHGLGEPPAKRACGRGESGGAVIGRGLHDWI